ncbi:hypothetical protein [Aestuariivirga sp.]|uniref:hypothetical protein n=1 Tax=Aestuariivirga sp. TaxID=2650926 RepID=UPI00391C3CB9
MCDYSLEQQQNRPAAAGDRLVTAAFSSSTTRGFCADGEPDLAVCLLPGTEIAFDEPVRFSGLFSFLLQAHQHDCLLARFRHVNEDNPLLHHDALEFANGEIVLLTHLRDGQRATVIQLPATGEARSEHTAPAPQAVL